jgi:hypothetical protein
MRIFNYNFDNELIFFGVFIGTASILWYSFVILRLGRIIIYFNQIYFKFKPKQSIYKKTILTSI